jgi:hypothetical protein
MTSFSVVILPLPHDSGGTRKYLWKRRDICTEGYAFKNCLKTQLIPYLSLFGVKVCLQGAGVLM